MSDDNRGAPTAHVNEEGGGGVEASGPPLLILDAEGRLSPTTDLVALQMQLEASAARMAAEKAAAALEAAEARGSESVTAYGARALASRLERLTDALRAAMTPADRRGAKSALIRRCVDLDAETVAFLTLTGLLNGLAGEPKLAAASIRLGALIEEEVVARALVAGDDKAAASVKRLADPARRRRRLRGLSSDAQEAARRPSPWGRAERQRIGLALIDAAVTSLDLFEIVDTWAPPRGAQKPKRIKRLVASAALSAVRSDAWAACRRAPAVGEPMVTPPRSWRDAFTGGYLTSVADADAGRLVKTRDHATLRALTPAAAPVVFSAVNAAQATAWQVNREILAAIQAFDAETGAGDVLRSRPSAENVERNATRAERSRRLAFDRIVSQARRFELFDAIYFPYQMDFRGRLYPAPDFNPQGPDVAKALLRFSAARPLGDEGWKWLAIHLCNCGDFGRMSKAPLAARAEWTLAHEERILTVAADPLADLWWTEADAPWQFLAACFEWAGFCAEGEGFASQLPIALDGACSGLQHFSLALRDEVGGGAVNLTPRGPGDGAADIYGEVAASVRALLRDDLDASAMFGAGRDAEGRPRDTPVATLARQWLAFGVDRKLCKRPTMTYGYGARGYGYVDQILNDTLEPARAARRADPAALWPFEGDGFVAALYLAARMTEAIERTVLKAAEAMRWLQQVAAVAAAEGRPLRWTTPDGFPVLQAYPDQKIRRVKAVVAGRSVRISAREDTGRLDARRQRQGVAPNYVHSLDACHLRLTVVRAAEEGITDFALVHDSFGVPAAETPRFFQLIRETLVEMYDAVDVVAAFRNDVSAGLSPEARAALAEPPAPGRLILGDVMESDFCFS